MSTTQSKSPSGCKEESILKHLREITDNLPTLYGLPRKKSVSEVKVLIVDSSAEFRQALLQVLCAKGYQVEAVDNRTIAASMVCDRAFDVVVMGLGAPGMDWLEFMDVARRCPGTVTVIVTGRPTLESAVAACNRGVWAYLLKPLNVGVLLSKLGELIDAT